MGPIACWRTSLSRYADFHGRARRAEFWWFELFVLLVIVVFFGVVGALGGFAKDANSGALGLLMMLLLLILAIPRWAVAVRRLHDADSSGWLALLMVIPLFGLIAGIVFGCLPGTVGPNRHGQDPRGREPMVGGPFLP